LENGYIPLGGLFDKSFKSLPFDLIAVLFGPKDPHPNDLGAALFGQKFPAITLPF
jgi:hypothetical protein